MPEIVLVLNIEKNKNSYNLRLYAKKIRSETLYMYNSSTSKFKACPRIARWTKLERLRALSPLLLQKPQSRYSEYVRIPSCIIFCFIKADSVKECWKNVNNRQNRLSLDIFSQSFATVRILPRIFMGSHDFPPDLTPLIPSEFSCNFFFICCSNTKVKIIIS